MAKAILHDISPSSQELIALGNVINRGFEAFKSADYPHFYKDYLMALLAIIQLGSAAVMAAYHEVSHLEFSTEVDKLSSFIAAINYNLDAYTP